MSCILKWDLNQNINVLEIGAYRANVLLNNGLKDIEMFALDL